MSTISLLVTMLMLDAAMLVRVENLLCKRYSLKYCRNGVIEVEAVLTDVYLLAAADSPVLIYAISVASTMPANHTSRTCASNGLPERETWRIPGTSIRLSSLTQTKLVHYATPGLAPRGFADLSGRNAKLEGIFGGCAKMM